MSGSARRIFRNPARTRCDPQHPKQPPHLGQGLAAGQLDGVQSLPGLGRGGPLPHLILHIGVDHALLESRSRCRR